MPGQESELSRPLCSKELARNRETERERKKKERERERERKERKKDTGTKALMEQKCFNQRGVGIYTVVILSKDWD